MPGLRLSGKIVPSPSVVLGEDFFFFNKQTAPEATNGVNPSPSARMALGKDFPECTSFGSRGRRLYREEILRALFPERCTRGRLLRVQLGLPRMHLALGEATPSRSAAPRLLEKSWRRHYTNCRGQHCCWEIWKHKNDVSLENDCEGFVVIDLEFNSRPSGFYPVIPCHKSLGQGPSTPQLVLASVHNISGGDFSPPVVSIKKQQPLPDLCLGTNSL